MMQERPLPDRREGRWPVWRLALLIYPLAAGAVAINLYMLGLMGQAIGLPAIAPIPSVGLGLVLGIPASMWFGGHLRRWMDEAE